MPLRSPILDDRSYAQLRDELVARIPVYTPEWTDHHPSDPGITLLELFAFLGENLLFRFNQIPDATKLAFLRLLDIPLRPAVAGGRHGGVHDHRRRPACWSRRDRGAGRRGGVPHRATRCTPGRWPRAAAIRARHEDELDEDTAEYLARASAAVRRLGRRRVPLPDRRSARPTPHQPGGDVLDPGGGHRRQALRRC